MSRKLAVTKSKCIYYINIDISSLANFKYLQISKNSELTKFDIHAKFYVYLLYLRMAKHVP